MTFNHRVSITNPDENQGAKAGGWTKQKCYETCKQGNDVEFASPSRLPYQLEAGQRNFAHIHWTSFCNVDKPRFQNCHST